MLLLINNNKTIMRTKLFLSIPFIFFLAIPFLHSQTYKINAEWSGFNNESKEAIYLNILDSLNQAYASESNSYRVDRMRWIKYKLDYLLSTAPINQDSDDNNQGCSIGNFTKNSENESVEATEIVITWADIVPNVIAYTLYHLDLTSIIPVPNDESVSTLAGTIPSGQDPIVRLPFNTAGLHMFVVRTNCSSSQSEFTIIIVEKVISIINGLYVPCVLFPEDLPEPRLSGSELNITMNIYPNLVSDSEVQIDLSLNEIQYIHLNLFDGTTGKFVKNILRKQEVPRGNRNYKLNMAGLSPGMYFVVLQTDSKRIVKRLIKI